jgi:hypothetical protein
MATLLFFSLLCSLSFGRPQSLEPVPHTEAVAIRWKIGDLSLQSHSPSSLSARFLLFQQQPPPPVTRCDKAPFMVLLLNPFCLQEIATYKPNNDLVENGLVCEGGLKDQGNSTGWHTCNEYMEPRGNQVADEKKQWLWWRIYDVNIGDFTPGSIPIYNTTSKVQSNVRRGLYSAKLEIVKGETKYDKYVCFSRDLHKRSNSAIVVHQSRCHQTRWLQCSVISIT